LPGEVMHPVERAVRAQFLRRHGEIDGLQERVRPALGLGALRRRPMAERQKADTFTGFAHDAFANSSKTSASKARTFFTLSRSSILLKCAVTLG